MHGTWTPQSIDHTCLEDCYTKEVSHIGQCTDKPKADGPPSQSSIHALNTTTPGDLTQRTSTYERPFTHKGNYLVIIVILSSIGIRICQNKIKLFERHAFAMSPKWFHQV